MNMWRGENSAPITDRTLLPESFFDGPAPSGHAGFKTKEEWEAHKAELNRMAKFHEKIFQQAQAGERPTRTISNLAEHFALEALKKGN